MWRVRDKPRWLARWLARWASGRHCRPSHPGANPNPNAIRHPSTNPRPIRQPYPPPHPPTLSTTPSANPNPNTIPSSNPNPIRQPQPQPHPPTPTPTRATRNPPSQRPTDPKRHRRVPAGDVEALDGTNRDPRQADRHDVADRRGLRGVSDRRQKTGDGMETGAE